MQRACLLSNYRAGGKQPFQQASRAEPGCVASSCSYGAIRRCSILQKPFTSLHFRRPQFGWESFHTRIMINDGARRPRGSSITSAAMRMENMELVIGDVLALLCFALWKQVAALASQPDFPGWLAPLSINPVAIADFTSFCLTLTLTWVTSSLLVGGYMGGASKDLLTALRATSMTWLVSMPVILAQLILVTALESRSLVGQPGFGNILPLAASGPGEPLPSAAGVLGLMVGWRAYYTTNLDWFANVSEDDKRRFREAVATTILISGGCIAVLKVLYLALDHEMLEELNAAVSFSISEVVSAQSMLGA